MSAKIEKVIGGPRWWHRFFGRPRGYGLLIRLTKQPIDWQAFNRYREVATAVDKMVDDAVAFEKTAKSLTATIERYEKAISAIIELNKSDQTAAAHRYRHAPINRLTIILGREKRIDEAKAIYESWAGVVDPIGLPKAEQKALEKRMAKAGTR